MAEASKTGIKFGTEGWRGVISENFTFENVSLVAETIAQNRPYGVRTAIIGYDNRFLSEHFAKKTADVLSRHFNDVLITDSPVTTPNLCFTTKKTGHAIGIMITASHNSYNYNGMKIKDSSGGPASNIFYKKVEKIILSEKTRNQERGSSNENSINKTDFSKKYISYLKKSVDLPAIKKIRKTIAFDMLYGTSGRYISSIFNRAGKVALLRTNRDPLFCGINPEPIEKNLSLTREYVVKSKAIAGIAFDGDGDRLGVVDERGKYLTPHIVFPLLVFHAIKNRKKRGMIVQTISLGYLSKRIAQKYNLPFLETPVGFKNISPVMLSNDVIAAGEESGGYSVCSEIPDRDGILSGLLFLELLSMYPSVSSMVNELMREFGSTYFLRRDIEIKEIIFDKKSFTDKVLNLIPERINNRITCSVRSDDGIKIYFSDDSWLMLRPSGTEPVLRIYSETDSKKNTLKMLDFGEKVVKEYSRGKK
jgi:phosphomannomutase